MPRATSEYPTPELRETRFVRATRPVTVELHQPVAFGEVRTTTGRVLGEMRVNGCLHHYRVLVADGTVILALPEWVQLPDGRKLKAEPMWAEVAA